MGTLAACWYCRHFKKSNGISDMPICLKFNKPTHSFDTCKQFEETGDELKCLTCKHCEYWPERRDGERWHCTNFDPAKTGGTIAMMLNNMEENGVRHTPQWCPLLENKK